MRHVPMLIVIFILALMATYLAIRISAVAAPPMDEYRSRGRTTAGCWTPCRRNVVEARRVISIKISPKGEGWPYLPK